MLSVLWHFLFGVVVVGALLWASAWAARRWSSRFDESCAGRSEIRVVSRQQVARGAWVVRISLDDKDVLVGASQHGVNLLLDELPKSSINGAAVHRMPEFGDLIGRLSFWQR